MTPRPAKAKPRGLQKIGAVVGKVIEPAAAKRGFAVTGLIAAWAEIVGERYGATTQPESISWPRGAGKSDAPGTLSIRAAGGVAVYLQHEQDQLIERINAFLGYRAVGAIRVKQLPPERRGTPVGAPPRALLPEERSAIGRMVEGIDDDGLRDALARLGGSVLAEGSPKSDS